MVPVGERALRRGRVAVRARGRWSSQRTAAEPAPTGDVAVQRDDVPVAERVAVVAGAAIARRRGRRNSRSRACRWCRCRSLMVARARIRARQVPSPARLVAVVVVGRRAVEIGVVARGEDERLGHLVDQLRGRLGVSAAVGADAVQSAMSPAPTRYAVRRYGGWGRRGRGGRDRASARSGACSSCRCTRKRATPAARAAAATFWSPSKGSQLHSITSAEPSSAKACNGVV